MRLDRKTAVLTDGSFSICKRIAERLTRDDTQVLIADLNEHDAVATVGGIFIRSMRTILSIASMLTVFIMLWSGDLHAADGIGFAQAEEGTWYCRGDDPVATLDCARRKCRAQSGGQECFQTKWCGAAGWSGLMGVFLSEFHSTEIICGAPSEAALRAGLKAFCAGSEYAQSRSIFLLVDPDGKKSELLDESFPGPKAN